MAILTASRWLPAPAIPAPAPTSAGFTVRAADVVRAAVFLLVVGNLGRVPIGSVGAKDAPILFNDLMVLAVLATGLLAGVRARTWRIDAAGIFAIAFAAVGGGSAILAVPRFGLSAFELAFSLAYLARWLAYFGIYLVVINTVRTSDIPSIWRALEGAILAFAAFGILQSVFLPNFALIVYPSATPFIDWDPQGHRLVSTILDPNLAGALLLLVLLPHLALLSTGAAVPLWKPVLLVSALMLTLSRGAFVAFLAGGALILAVRGIPRRLLRLVALVALLSLPFVPTLFQLARTYNRFSFNDASALTRVAGWLRGLTVFADNPVFGIGFNTFGFVQEAYGFASAGKASFGIDGGLLYIAVMTGLVGLALYVGMIALVMRRCRRIWRDRTRNAEHRGLAIGVAAATAAILVHSLFINALLFPFIMEQLWILWALIFVMSAPESERMPVVRGPLVASLGRVLQTRS
jgi:O-antigen ligase